MRILRSEWARDLDEQLGIINYSAIRPTITRRRRSGRWHVMPGPTLRPISFGYVGWMAFLVFWIVFGRALLFFLMLGGFLTSTKGLEVTLARTVERAWDLERSSEGLVIVDDEGRPILDPDRHLVYRLDISTTGQIVIDIKSDMIALCDESRRLQRVPTLAVASGGGVPYADVVATIDAVRQMHYSHGCEPRFLLVSPETEAATHNKRMHLPVTSLAVARAAPAGDAQRYAYKNMRREYVRAAGLSMLLFALACAPRGAAVSPGEVSERTYFGATALINHGMFILGVEPVEASRPNHLGVRLSLMNRSTDPLAFCTGHPWSYDATVNGERRGYNPIISAGGICNSDPLEVDPGETARWAGELIFDGDPSGIVDLWIELRVYPLDESGQPNRKEFHTLSAYWQVEA